MSDAAIAQIVTLVTLIVGFVWQWMREKRQRQWDREDRMEVAAQRLATAERLAEKVAETGEQLTKQIEHKTTLISDSLAENTKINTEALVVANNVNEKILTLGLTLNKKKK